MALQQMPGNRFLRIAAALAASLTILLLVGLLCACKSVRSEGVAAPARAEPDSATAAHAFHIQRDVVYARQGAEDLYADVYLPEPGSAAGSEHGDARLRPAIVLIHGGSWQRGDRKRMVEAAQTLARHGFAAVNIEYRLAPAHRFPAQLEDCRAAVRWVRENHSRLQVDPQRVAAFGYSAGAHLALLLATDHRGADDPARIQAVVAGGGPVDLTSFGENRPMYRLFGASLSEAPELYRQASPIEHVSSDDPPTFLFHGRDDWVVPVEQSRRMAERLRQNAVPVELQESDRGHLRAAVNQELELRSAIRFLKRYL